MTEDEVVGDRLRREALTLLSLRLLETFDVGAEVDLVTGVHLVPL